VSRLAYSRFGYPVQISKAVKCLVTASVIFLGGGSLHDLGAVDEPERLFEGKVSVEIRGPGAAPLGIASAVFASTALAYNLGRLQELELEVEPVNPIQVPGVEVYKGDLQFILEHRGRGRWSAQSFSLLYSLDDRTRFSQDKVVIADQLHAAGNASWRAMKADNRTIGGLWDSPSGWQPGFEPSIDLYTFEAPSAAACENPGWAMVRAVRTMLTPQEQRVTCFALEVHVAHPMEITGSSAWTSPIGEVRLDAENGVYRFSGSAVGGEIAKKASSMPLPPGTPPETAKAIRSMGELASVMERLLGEGLPEIDLSGPWTWERTYRGVLRNDAALVRQAYPILTGATVYETALVGKGPIVDIWRDGQQITGRTIDVVVGERLNLEGVVEMADGPVSEWRWDIPGEVVERFTVEWALDGERNSEGEPVKSGVRGYPDFLEDDERKDKTVSFLWWDEGRHRIVLRATAGGNTGEAEVVFNVEEPHVTVETDVGENPVGGIQAPPGGNPESTEMLVIAGYIDAATHEPIPGGEDSGGPRKVSPYAIRMWHDRLPDKYPGETQWVQLVREDGTKLLDKQNTVPPHCFETHHESALDKEYPYVKGPNMFDLPGLPVSEDSHTISVDLTMVFETWLMYRPHKPDADWVPLRIVDWSWQGAATRVSEYVSFDVDGPTVTVAGERPADYYPVWNRRAWDKWEAAECPPE